MKKSHGRESVFIKQVSWALWKCEGSGLTPASVPAQARIAAWKPLNHSLYKIKINSLEEEGKINTTFFVVASALAAAQLKMNVEFLLLVIV